MLEVETICLSKTLINFYQTVNVKCQKKGVFIAICMRTQTLTLYIRWYPDSCELATSLGLLYMKTGHYQHAFEKLGSALAHDPMCTKALLAAGSMMQVCQICEVVP
jgi:uncharacterized protein HemY